MWFCSGEKGAKPIQIFHSQTSGIQLIRRLIIANNHEVKILELLNTANHQEVKTTLRLQPHLALQAGDLLQLPVTPLGGVAALGSGGRRAQVTVTSCVPLQPQHLLPSFTNILNIQYNYEMPPTAPLHTFDRLQIRTSAKPSKVRLNRHRRLRSA